MLMEIIEDFRGGMKEIRKQGQKHSPGLRRRWRSNGDKRRVERKNK